MSQMLPKMFSFRHEVVKHFFVWHLPGGCCKAEPVVKLSTLTVSNMTSYRFDEFASVAQFNCPHDKEEYEERR